MKICCKLLMFKESVFRSIPGDATRRRPKTTQSKSPHRNKNNRPNAKTKLSGSLMVNHNAMNYTPVYTCNNQQVLLTNTTPSQSEQQTQQETNYPPYPTAQNPMIKNPDRPQQIRQRRPNGIYVPGTNMKLSGTIAARLNTIFLYFCRRSTIHGLNHMAQAKSAKRRLFWFTISFFASIGFLINLYYLIEKYVQRQVLTNVYHDFQNFVFPDITFCNINPMYFPPEGTPEYNKLINVIEQYNIKYKKKFVPLSDVLYVQDTNIYSQPAWSTIVHCKYMGQRCNYSHFDVISIWPYGNCFTFNATKRGSSRRISQNMQYNGFRPDFKVIIYKSLQYPKFYKMDLHHSIIVPSGILVMIHEANTFPHIGDSFIVDDCTQIDLKIVMKSHLKSLKKCNPHRTNYSYMNYADNSIRNYVGRNFDCVYAVKQSKIVEHCECLFHMLPVDQNYQHLNYCLSLPDMNKRFRSCFYKYRKDFQSQQPVLKECYQDQCDHTSFITVISHSKYPAVVERNTQLLWLSHLKSKEDLEIQHYNRSDLRKMAILEDPNVTSIREALRNDRTDLLNIEFVERNFMMLRVVPSSLFMDKVEESEEYPLSRLLSDIGGCVGLWVGASLITLFEFADLILDFSDTRSLQKKPKSFHAQNGLRPNHPDNKEFDANDSYPDFGGGSFSSWQDGGSLTDRINTALLGNTDEIHDIMTDISPDDEDDEMVDEQIAENFETFTDFIHTAEHIHLENFMFREGNVEAPLASVNTQLSRSNTEDEDNCPPDYSRVIENTTTDIVTIL